MMSKRKRQNPDEQFLQRVFSIMNSTSSTNSVNETDSTDIERREVDTEDYNDDDDDDDEKDTGGEDIAIEEDMENEKTSSTTETLDKAEIKMKMAQEKIAVNGTNGTDIGDENDEHKANGSWGGTAIVNKEIEVFLLTLVWYHYLTGLRN